MKNLQRPWQILIVEDSENDALLLQLAIERSGAAPIGLASISSVHWSDSGLIDIDRVGAALRQRGAALLVDATQSAGVLAMDVPRLDPDFVIFPTYKWLLGPYGRAFLYVAKRRQGGIPLEGEIPASAKTERGCRFQGR